MLTYSSLAEKCLSDPQLLDNVTFRQSIIQQAKELPDADIFNLCFIAWLIARCEKKNAYAMMLALVDDGKSNSSANI